MQTRPYYPKKDSGLKRSLSVLDAQSTVCFKERRNLLMLCKHEHALCAVPIHTHQALGDKGQYLCGENTSPVTHWECTAALRTHLALLVSTRDTVPLSSPRGKREPITVGKSMGPGVGQTWVLDLAQVNHSEHQFLLLESRDR